MASCCIYLWNKSFEGVCVELEGGGRGHHVGSDIVLESSGRGVDKPGSFDDVICEPEIEHLGGVDGGRERRRSEGSLHWVGNGIKLPL